MRRYHPDGWWYDRLNRQFLLFVDNGVAKTVSEEAWAEYWKYYVLRERWIMPNEEISPLY